MTEQSEVVLPMPSTPREFPAGTVLTHRQVSARYELRTAATWNGLMFVDGRCSLVQHGGDRTGDYDMKGSDGWVAGYVEKTASQWVEVDRNDAWVLWRCQGSTVALAVGMACPLGTTGPDVDRVAEQYRLGKHGYQVTLDGGCTWTNEGGFVPRDVADLVEGARHCSRCTVHEDGIHVLLDNGLCGHCVCDLRNEGRPLIRAERVKAGELDPYLLARKNCGSDDLDRRATDALEANKAAVKKLAAALIAERPREQKASKFDPRPGIDDTGGFSSPHYED